MDASLDVQPDLWRRCLAMVLGGDRHDEIPGKPPDQEEIERILADWVPPRRSQGGPCGSERSARVATTSCGSNGAAVTVDAPSLTPRLVGSFSSLLRNGITPSRNEALTSAFLYVLPGWRFQIQMGDSPRQLSCFE